MNWNSMNVKFPINFEKYGNKAALSDHYNTQRH